VNNASASRQEVQAPGLSKSPPLTGEGGQLVGREGYSFLSSLKAVLLIHALHDKSSGGDRKRGGSQQCRQV
jgi:hypothetical protein